MRPSRGGLPGEAIAAYEKGDRDGCERITFDAMESITNMRWMVTQGMYAFGKPRFADFLDEIKAYKIEPVVERIACPCLVMEAQGDQFFKGQPKRVFGALRAPKAFVTFGPQDGAENHCQSGALAYKDQVVFDWLDETLGHAG